MPGPMGKLEKPQIRLCVIETVVIQRMDAQPFAVETRWGRTVEQDEQPWQRRFKVGEDWQQIDCGWFKPDEVGHLILSNEEGRVSQSIPTAEERADMSRRVVDLATMADDSSSVPFASIHPLESLRLTPVNIDRFLVRCRSGDARLTLTLFPL